MTDSISNQGPSPTVILLMNITNLILGIVLFLSILLIIFGSIGYIWNIYKINKKKEKKFGKMLICGIIIFITIIIIYGMLIPAPAPGGLSY